MKQMNLFWKTKRKEKHTSLIPPIFRLNSLVDFEIFRSTLLKIRNPSPQGGRPPLDEVVMFKILVLQRLYQLSDDAMEFQLYDRRSFLTFVGIKDGDTIPDAKTIWSFRNALSQAGLAQELFKTFDALLQKQGYHARSGQILDAEIIEVRRPRSQKDEDYETSAAKAQVDRDASYTKKRNETYFGYKNHVSIDRRHKFVRVYSVETAAPHDSQFFEPLLDPNNSSLDLWADSAYKSREIDGICESKAYRNHIHHRAYRNKPLNGHQKRSNTAKSRVRARIEHVFAQAKNWGKRFMVRGIGITRNRFDIGLKNLVYNLRRYEFLERRWEQCA